MFRAKFLVEKKKKKKKLTSVGLLIFFFPRESLSPGGVKNNMLSVANVPADSLVLTIGSDGLSTPLERAPTN